MTQRQLIVAAGLIFAFKATCWLVMVEKFPLTSWQMYAEHSRAAGSVDFWTLHAVRADGSRYRTDLSEFSDVLDHGRFVTLISWPSTPSDNARIQRVLRHLVREYNVENRRAARIVGFDMEARSFRLRPGADIAGESMQNIRFSIETPAAEPKAG